ncbi:DUF2339 domain-containing protein, partial [bacterium]|nr:DUF2339 domain-containing protein [bacterium]
MNGEDRLSKLERRIRKLEETLFGHGTDDAVSASAPVKPTRDIRPESQPVFDATEGKADASLENILTVKWFSWVGIVMFTLGIAFFLKYMVENSLIGPMGRVISGVLTGAFMIIFGDALQKGKHKSYGQVLAGGGIAVLYLAVYSAFHFYQLIAQIPAFIIMLIITAVSSALAIRYSSKAIILLSIVGGFATPALISTGVVNEIPLFTYLAGLNMGILAITFFFRWRSINLIAFLFTQIWLQNYFSSYFKPELRGLMFFFTTLYFVIYLLVNVFYNLRKKISATREDLILLLANAAFYFGMVYYKIIEPDMLKYWGSFLAVVLGALYFINSQITASSNKDDKYFTLAQLGLGITFITIAIPVALDWHWVTMAWATEAILLLWLGFRAGDSATRAVAAGLFTVVAARLLIFDTVLRGDYTLIANTRTVTFIFCLTAIYAAIKMFKDNRESLNKEELNFPSVLLVFFHFLALWCLSAESRGYWMSRNALGLLGGSLSENIGVTYSVLWAMYAFCVMVYGVLKREVVLRSFAIVIFVITAAKIFLVDSAQLGLGLRMISFVLMGSILLIIS